MKAICLLICIALARDGVANIFQQRRSQPEISRYLVQSSESDQFENEPVYLQNQYKNDLIKEWRAEEQRKEQHPKQKKYNYPQYRQKEYEHPQSRFSDKAERQYKQQKPIEHQYKYQAPVEQQYRSWEPVEYQYRFQEPVERQYRFQQPEQHNKNYNNIKTPHIYKQQDDDNSNNEEQVINRYADAVTESQEIQDVVQRLTLLKADQHALPKFDDMETVPGVYTSIQNDVYGDTVAWRPIKMASNSEYNRISQNDIEKYFTEAEKATKPIDRETKTMFHKNVNVAINTENEDTHLNATQLLKKYQYPVEEHTIKTEDGYLLTLFRIPPKQMSSEVKQRPVVFLMHGLLSCADEWLLMGPHESLAYQLADAGYDVWLGNARSSRYSHHVSMQRVNPSFWQFSNDEIALYDLPAMIDYVLQTSNQQKMVYIGHSLGTTAFFALAAARPVYNDKIVVMYAMAPMTYMTNVRSPLMRMIAPNSDLYNRLDHQLGRGEFKPSKEVVRTLGGVLCQREIECRHLCSNVYPVMTGVNVEHVNASIIPLILSHLPSGASTKQMKQYGQSVDSHDFRMYDYGAELNKQVYGETQPPKYDMTAVTAPVALFYSEHDWLAHPKDVQTLKEQLPNVTEEYKIPQEYFTNMDFQFSNQAQDVYQKLIESIKKHYPY